MPYLYKPRWNNPEEDQNNNTQTLLNTESSNVVPQGNPEQQQRGPSRSGAYTNLQSYLNANQEQSKDLADKTSQNIRNEADQARAKADEVSNSFQSKVAQGRTDFDSTLVDEAVSNPGVFSKDESKMQSFIKQRDASYGGPSDITEEKGWATAASQAKRAQDYSDLSQSEGGRYALLGEMFGRPDYARGQKKLDNLLLQNNPDSKQTFQQTRDYVQPLASDLQSKQSAANLSATQAKQGTDDARSRTRGALQGGRDTLLSTLDSRIQGLNDARTATQGKAQSGLQNYDLDKATAELLGFGSDIETYGVDPSRFLQIDNTELNRSNVATDDEDARLAALAELAGEENTVLNSEQYKGTGVGFDRASFDAATQSRLNNLIADEIDEILPHGGTKVSEAVEWGWQGKYPSYDAAYRAKRDELISQLKDKYSKIVRVK